jgi:flavin reductase (DIM6/NTAB) family NADH-FMN oxidoreductase RutF
MRAPVALRDSYLLLNHGPTTLIASAHGSRRNVMAAAWVMAIDFEPPKLAAVIAADTFTRELVDQSGEFVVSLPTVAMAGLTWAVGSCSGRDTDKFERLRIGTAAASVVRAPLVDGCAAWLECRVLPEPDIAQRYDLVLAEVVAAWADDESFRNRRWQFADDAHKTIHHLRRGTFFATGAVVEGGDRE